MNLTEFLFLLLLYLYIIYSMRLDFKTPGSTCQTPTGSVRLTNSNTEHIYVTNLDYKDWPKGTKIYADAIILFRISDFVRVYSKLIKILLIIAILLVNFIFLDLFLTKIITLNFISLKLYKIVIKIRINVFLIIILISKFVMKWRNNLIFMKIYLEIYLKQSKINILYH